MKTKFLSAIGAMLILAFAFTGCKKDSSSSSPGDSYVAPTVGTTATVQVPSTLTGTVSTTVSAYASIANSFAALGSYLTNIPSDATVSDLKSTGKSYTWTRTSGSESVTIWINFSNDGITKTWDLYLKTSQYVVKTLVMTASELITGSGGSLTFYGNGGTNLVYTWTKSSTSTTATILYGNTYYMTFTSNTDLSGNLVVYNGTNLSGIKVVEVIWNSSKHGTWYVKDNNPTNGTF